jgi:4-amino-4-deoxy-L-arabinose transferase-like glycosyltransferase
MLPFFFDRVKLPTISSSFSKLQPIQWMVALLCLIHFALACLFIPLLGLQNDEALFAWAIYEPRAGAYIAPFFQAQLTLMLMSYLGALKGWIYKQVFRLARPSLASIRIPVVLAGIATIWLFYKLLRRISGNRAAAAGCLLLATDSIFLLTNTFDWGPVALQHLLLVGGLFLVLVFYQQASLRALGGGFFLLGLGLWDKALMLWMLGGCGVATLLVFPRQLIASLRPKPIAVAVLAFAIGALPLVVYNYNNNWETFRGNTSFDFTDVPNKARLLKNTFNGTALFGWMVAEDHEPPVPRQPANLLQRASFALSEAAGHRRENWMLYGAIAALLLAPLARGAELRAILFALIAMAVGWSQMAITRNAGGSVHHAVLIWPFPHLLMAVSFAAASRRLRRWGAPALALALVLLCGSNLVVLNQYHVQAVRNGGALNWNDAIVPLNAYLKDVPASRMFCVDWGILDSLRLLSRGRLPVRVGSDPVSKPQLTQDDVEVVRNWVKERDHLFIAHTEGNEFFLGANAQLVKTAAALGYERELLRTIGDRYGRAVFEVYRFRPVSEP